MIYKVGKEQGTPGSLTDDRSLNREESWQFLGLGNRRAIEEAASSVKHSGPNCRETPVLLRPSPHPVRGEGGLPDGRAQRELEVRDPAAHKTLAAQRMRVASRCRRQEAARASRSRAAHPAARQLCSRRLGPNPGTPPPPPAAGKWLRAEDVALGTRARQGDTATSPGAGRTSYILMHPTQNLSTWETLIAS